jgi:hypothetical protein
VPTDDGKEIPMFVYYLCAAVTAISASVSLGFAIDAYRKARPAGGGATTNALYALSRSVALALVGLVPFFFSSIPFLSGLAILMIVVQAMDALIGYRNRNGFKSCGPLLTSLGNLAVFLWLILR